MLKLNKLAGTLRDNNGVKLVYDDAAVDKIVERCHDAETGARNIDFIINVNLLPKLSSFVLQSMAQGNSMPETISVGIDGDGEFSIESKSDVSCETSQEK